MNDLVQLAFEFGRDVLAHASGLVLGHVVLTLGHSGKSKPKGKPGDEKPKD